MSSSDLAKLFAPPAAGMVADNGVVQGTMVAFSNVDGSNTVNVFGSTLENVPMLLTGAEVNYSAGDAVVLIVLGNTFMLLGKVVRPGSSKFASASVSAAAAGNSASGFSIPGGGGATTRVSTSIAVPAWAHTAAITVWASASVHPTFGTDVVVGSNMNGLLVASQVFQGVANSTSEGFSGGTFTYTVTGISTLAIDGWMSTGATTITANGANYIVANISAVFFR